MGFNKGGSKAKTKIFNIDAGGLRTGKKGRFITAESSPERSGLVQSIAETFPEQAELLSGLRGMVAPGVSALRESRLTSSENARRRAIGNLRENLQRRKVLGSSFAQDALTRSEIEFAQERDRIEAESTLLELDLTQQLAAKEFEAKRSEFNTFLNELNLQADLASGIRQQATSEANANARLNAELNAAAAAGFGELVGTIGGAFLGGPAGASIGSRFFGGGAA